MTRPDRADVVAGALITLVRASKLSEPLLREALATLLREEFISSLARGGMKRASAPQSNGDEDGYE